MNIVSEFSLAQEFQRNADSIAMTLIRRYSLKFNQEISSLSVPLLRWLDFRYRYIEPQPRKVVFSNKFPKRDAPLAVTSALDNFVRMICSGDDVNPYQGRGLILRNDTSGERKDARTDLLWADWGIHHFHLTNDPIPVNQYFSRSADFLVFCLVGGGLVAFIDVLPHPNKQGFANPSLIKTVAENWPDYMEQFRLNGIFARQPSREFAQADIHALRSNGISMGLNLNGILYMSPGGGVTSAATPEKIVLVESYVRKSIKNLAKLVCDPDGQFRTSEVEPKYSLAMTPRGLSVFEEKSETAFILPYPQLGQPASFLEIIHEVLFPIWARSPETHDTISTS